MKKIYALTLLLAVTLVTLSACGGKNTNLTNAQPVEEETQDTETAQEYEPTQEILDAPLNSYKFQLGDTVLQFPCTVGDLLNAGAKYKDSELTENAFLPGRETNNMRNTRSKLVKMVFDSQAFSVVVVNYSETDTLLTDCTVINLNVDYKDGASAPPPTVFFPRGLTIGSIDPDLVEQYKAFDLQTLPQTETCRVSIAKNEKNGETKIISYSYYPSAE